MVKNIHHMDEKEQRRARREYRSLKNKYKGKKNVEDSDTEDREASE